MADALTFGTVVGLTLSSSVLAAGLAQGITAYRERGNRTREVSYLALRLATKFERYAQDASFFILAISDYHSSRAQGVSTELPPLGDLPSEQERWRDLPVELTAEVLAFDGDRRSDQESIDDTSREDVEASIDQALIAATLLGIRALNIAALLRKRNMLPPFNTEAGWLEMLLVEYQELPDHKKTPFRLDGPPPMPWWKRGPFMMLPQRSFDI